jgi:hypothetical protein
MIDIYVPHNIFQSLKMNAARSLPPSALTNHMIINYRNRKKRNREKNQ